MARFFFKLQPLLVARQAAERKEQLAVAQLERERIGLEARLRRQQEMIVQGRDVLRHGLLGAIDTVALRFHAGSAMRLMRDGQQMALELAGLHQKIEHARAGLANAAAARRAIELLRDRRFDQWKRGLEKQEASAMDDLVGSQAARQQEAVP